MGAAVGQAVGAAEGDRGAGAAQDRGDPGEVQRGGGPDRLLLHVRRGQPRAHFQVLQGKEFTVLNKNFILTLILIYLSKVKDVSTSTNRFPFVHRINSGILFQHQNMS